MHGWRGLFIFAVPDIEKAKRLTATDPVIGSGERVAESHVHRKLSKKGFLAAAVCPWTQSTARHADRYPSPHLDCPDDPIILQLF